MTMLRTPHTCGPPPACPCRANGALRAAQKQGRPPSVPAPRCPQWGPALSSSQDGLALPPGLGAPESVRRELASLETLGRGAASVEPGRPSRGSRLGCRSRTLAQVAGGRSAGVPRRPGRSSRRLLASSYCSG